MKNILIFISTMLVSILVGYYVAELVIVPISGLSTEPLLTDNAVGIYFGSILFFGIIGFVTGIVLMAKYGE